jgi:hypothetical protein
MQPMYDILLAVFSIWLLIPLKVHFNIETKILFQQNTVCADYNPTYNVP